MTHDDALLAFERHARASCVQPTIASIATLGFRGEALQRSPPYRRLLLETRDEAEAEGHANRFAGGQLINVSRAGLPSGTTISVADIFYCSPARRKFLKSARRIWATSLRWSRLRVGIQRSSSSRQRRRRKLSIVRPRKGCRPCVSALRTQALEELVEIPAVRLHSARGSRAGLEPEEKNHR